MKFRRPSVRIEDERGNPVTFFQLKASAKSESREIVASPREARLTASDRPAPEPEGALAGLSTVGGHDGPALGLPWAVARRPWAV